MIFYSHVQVLCGALTDQCVEHAVRDAADANFLVTMVIGRGLDHLKPN